MFYVPDKDRVVDTQDKYSMYISYYNIYIQSIFSSPPVFFSPHKPPPHPHPQSYLVAIFKSWLLNSILK